MIEIKEIAVERDMNSYLSSYNNPYVKLEMAPYNNLYIELLVPYNLDVNEFYKDFQSMVDMENRKLYNRQFLRGGEFECSLTIPRADRYNIRKIYHNKEKATTVVVFIYRCYTIRSVVTGEDDPQKVIVKRDSDDYDDIYMAVASAVMIRKYKSNSQFKAHIRRSMPKGFDGRPDVYQMIAAAEVSDIYGSWEKFCKIVDEKLVLHG